MESAEARHVLFWQPKTVFKIKFDDKFTQISSQMDHLTKSHVFVQTMAWCRTGEKPLSEPNTRGVMRDIPSSAAITRFNKHDVPFETGDIGTYFKR